MNIFFSYPHDANTIFVLRLKKDLEARGHTVWFDKEKIKEGTIWRNEITRGILESETVVAFLSKHSVRDPGVCLNEIAIALAEKGDEAIVTVLVEPEKDVSAPVSITHIQWLKMEDHLAQSDNEGWYRPNFDKLVDLIEHPSAATRHEELGQLKDVLNPLSFNAEIAYHLPRFTGREWLVARYEDWLSTPSPGNANKVFRIEGGPGMGKTALVSYLAHAAKSSVLGVHLCMSGSDSTSNPVRLVLSLAYQMSTRLPDYRARLLKVPCIKNPELMKDVDAGSLWGMLISEPLAGAGKSGLIDRQRLAIVIDGLDEATKNGRNAIVELLVDHIHTLPSWVGLVLTGRPDPELTQSLGHFKPQVIDGNDPGNVQDLSHYIDSWLKDEVQAKRLQIHQVPAAARMLLQKSEGAFLYLAQARDEALQSSLDGSNDFDLSNPASLPSGLNALYQKSFSRRFPDVQSDPDNPATRWNALVKPLLAYILTSPEPLPLDLARELMGWDVDPTGNERQHKALQSLGSLVKRNGHDDKPETCTVALFHNSVREWLSSKNSQKFRVFAEGSLYPLTENTWKRYLSKNEIDGYAWEVLPQLLPLLPDEKQDMLFGEPNLDTCQVLFRLAESLGPKLRYTEAAASWVAQVRQSERLSHTDPEKIEFLHNLSLSFDNLGSALVSLGKTNEALGYYQRSLELRDVLSAQAPENTKFARDLSDSYHQLGNIYVNLGKTAEAHGHYHGSIKLLEALNANAPGNDELKLALSMSLNNFGATFASLGKHEEALDYYMKGFTYTKDLNARFPENTKYASILSLSYLKLGDVCAMISDFEKAYDAYLQSLKIAEKLSARAPENAEFSLGLSVCFDKLGDSLVRLEKMEEAHDAYQYGLKIIEILNAGAPENAIFARDLSFSLNKLGNTLASLGKIEEAQNSYQQGLKIAEKLNECSPENAEFTQILSSSLNTLGDLSASIGNNEEALRYYERSIKLLGDLSVSAPENTHFARNLSLCSGKLGDILGSLKNTDAAIDYYVLGLKIAENLSDRVPDNAQFISDLSINFDKLGTMLESMGRAEDALACYRRSFTLLMNLSAGVPENISFARELSRICDKLGDTLLDLGKTGTAIDYFSQGVKIAESLNARAPENAQFARVLSVSLNKLGQTLASLGKTNEAMDYYLRNVEIAADLSARAPENVEFARDLSRSLDTLGVTLASLGETDEALVCFQQSLKIAEDLSARAPENVEFARDLSSSLDKLGDTLASVGKNDEALAYFQRSLKIDEDLSAR